MTIEEMKAMIAQKTSAFARIEIRDDFFGDGMYYLVVHNTPEPSGKPGGWSMPGGGVPTDAVRKGLITEIKNETGVVADTDTIDEQPFSFWGERYAIRFPDEGRAVRYIDLARDGSIPREVQRALEEGRSVAIPKAYAYNVRIDWEGSALQALFRKFAPILQGARDKQFGSIFLGREEIRSLDPLPSEIANGEIDGISLVSPAYLQVFLKSYDLRTHEGWYYTHLKALLPE